MRPLIAKEYLCNQLVMVHCYVVDDTLQRNIIREPAVRQWENAGSENRFAVEIYFLSRPLYKYWMWWFTQNVEIKIDVRHNRIVHIEYRIRLDKYDVCNVYLVSQLYNFFREESKPLIKSRELWS